VPDEHQAARETVARTSWYADLSSLGWKRISGGAHFSAVARTFAARAFF